MSLKNKNRFYKNDISTANLKKEEKNEGVDLKKMFLNIG